MEECRYKHHDKCEQRQKSRKNNHQGQFRIATTIPKSKWFIQRWLHGIEAYSIMVWSIMATPMLGCKFRWNSGRNSGSSGFYCHFHQILDPRLFTFRSFLHWRTTGMWPNDVTKNPEVVGVRKRHGLRHSSTRKAISQSEITTWMLMQRCVVLCVLSFGLHLLPCFPHHKSKKRRKTPIRQHQQHQHVRL